MMRHATLVDVPVAIEADHAVLHGDLSVPDDAIGLVIFAHGSGSSRRSVRNRAVAQALREKGLATLVMDLLTESEEAIDLRTRAIRFDIALLADRVAAAVDWAARQPSVARLRIGLFGASTGAAAALIAAARRATLVSAVVSRGGRPDLAGNALPLVTAPTLLIVGGSDHVVIDLNQEAYTQIGCIRRLAIVPNATHLFEEPGALDQVATLAAAWFTRHLAQPVRSAEPETLHA